MMTYRGCRYAAVMSLLLCMGALAACQTQQQIVSEREKKNRDWRLLTG